MNAFWRLFDPLWRLIAANTWAACAILTAAMVGAFLIRQNFVAMLMGGALGSVLMCHAESAAAATPAGERPGVLPAA